MLQDNLETPSPAQAQTMQLRYTTMHGMLLRESGRTTPISLGACERDFGTEVFEQVMSSNGAWVDVPMAIPPMHRFAGHEEKLQGVTTAPARIITRRPAV